MGANAQTSVPAFTAGQVLTAAQVTQINTGIPVFASSTERDAAFGGAGEKTLAEGQMAYLEDTNATQYYDGSAWSAVAGGKILQVQTVTKTDTFSASVASGASSNVTGLSVSITPSSASSTIYLSGMVYGSTVSLYFIAIDIDRNGTSVINAASPSNRTPSLVSNRSDTGSGTYGMGGVPIAVIDSPASTSALTYQVRVVNVSAATRTMYVNRTDDDSDLDDSPRSISTLIAMEVSA